MSLVYAFFGAQPFSTFFLYMHTVLKVMVLFVTIKKINKSGDLLLNDEKRNSKKYRLSATEKKKKGNYFLTRD